MDKCDKHDLGPGLQVDVPRAEGPALNVRRCPDEGCRMDMPCNRTVCHFFIDKRPASKPKEATTASSICQTAADLTGGDRAKTHGDKVANHNNIATLWSAFLGVPITAQQVALMMVLLKVARTKAGTHNPDDYVDMAGYAGVSGEIAERTKP